MRVGKDFIGTLYSVEHALSIDIDLFEEFEENLNRH